MKTIRRIILLLAVMGVAICVVLLLNKTAPNPTHRRYSSQPVPSVDGRAAEDVIANDLGLTHNERSGATQCICNPNSSLKNSKCKACLFESSSCVTSLRIPDFVGADFIADSKNYTSRLSLDSQLSDFVCWSHENGLPLWIFVRKNTPVDSDLISQVESTGGGIVYYFTVPGYTDPVEDLAQRGLLLAGVMGVGVGWLEWRYLRRRVRVVVVNLPTGKPTPHTPLDKTSRKLSHAEDFVAASKDHLRDQLDADDVWGDEA